MRACRASASPPPRRGASRWPRRASPSRGGPTAAPIPRLFDRVGLVQIDSVNVLSRAHYLPGFSRLGPYDREALDRAAHYAPRRLFEYWGHEASLMPVELQPLLRWRMARAHDEAWGGMRRVAQRAAGAARGGAGAGARARPARRARPRRGAAAALGAVVGLVGVQEGDRAAVLERRGHLGAAAQLRALLRPARARAPEGGARRADAERGGRPARAGPARRDRARRGGGARAARLLPAARRPVRPRVAELVEAGELLPVEVEGWDRPAYLHRDARIPRRVDARALLGPFDNLLWERGRVERLFGFRFRLEIYVPKPKRVYGYYVLPFLLGDRLVARVDLKADRQAGLLRAHAVHLEPDAPLETAEALREELELLAGWLGLDGVYLLVALDERAEPRAQAAQPSGIAGSSVVTVVPS